MRQPCEWGEGRGLCEQEGGDYVSGREGVVSGRERVEWEGEG